MWSAGFNLLAPDYPYMSMEKWHVNHLPFEGGKDHETRVSPRSATAIKCSGNILEALSLKSEINKDACCHCFILHFIGGLRQHGRVIHKIKNINVIIYKEENNRKFKIVYRQIVGAKVCWIKD